MPARTYMNKISLKQKKNAIKNHFPLSISDFRMNSD